MDKIKLKAFTDELTERDLNYTTEKIGVDDYLVRLNLRPTVNVTQLQNLATLQSVTIKARSVEIT